MSERIRVARTLADVPEPERLADAAEGALLAGYLSSGTAILATTARVRDVYAPERGEVVPVSVRSDGVWVWSDAHAYYAERHGIAPESEFYEYIKAQGYRCRRIDADEAEIVLEAFYCATQ